MIQFGRLDAQHRWAAVDPHSVEEALGLLRKSLFDCSNPASDAEALLDGIELPTAAPTETYALHFADFNLPEQGATVAWASSRVYTPGEAWIRCVLNDQEGSTVAGLILKAERAYLPSEIDRAFEASFDSGRDRPGRYTVLDSQRIPRPSIRKISSGTGRGVAAEFYCENGACAGRAPKMYIQLQFREFHQHMIRPTGVVAYPCPFCPGDQNTRWALTFDSTQDSRSLRRDQSIPLLDYPIKPTLGRVVGQPGRMELVTGCGDSLEWGPTWNSDTVETFPPALLQCLQRPFLTNVLHAATTGLHVGRLATCILDPVNTRALVEHFRDLPESEKNADLAEALATIYNPRRRRNFDTEFDSIAADERFPYIASTPEEFLRALQYFGLLQHQGRFLDVGCGVGEKPFLAYGLGQFQQCDGIEINEQSLAVAGFLFDTIDCRFPYPINCMRADALTFAGYGDYDVVYMYRPLRPNELMGQLLRQIANQLRPGAMMFDVFSQSVALRREEDGFYELDPTAAASARWIGPVELDSFLQERDLL